MTVYDLFPKNKISEKFWYAVSAVPIIPSDTNCCNSRSDYAYGRRIGTALQCIIFVVFKHSFLSSQTDFWTFARSCSWI